MRVQPRSCIRGCAYHHEKIVCPRAEMGIVLSDLAVHRDTVHGLALLNRNVHTDAEAGQTERVILSGCLASALFCKL
jgi:hypothetical protein